MATYKDTMSAEDWSALLGIFPHTVLQSSCSPISLIPRFLAGIIPLADLHVIPTRTILTGTASYLDALIICPGIHQHQSADLLTASAELPATAAMTTGYVFRTENQAVVKFFQRIGVVGALATVFVETDHDAMTNQSWWYRIRHPLQMCKASEWSLPYLLCVVLTMLAATSCVLLQDWWATSAIALLVMARMANVIVIKRRMGKSWHGLPEPGVVGDLLVLLSQDRWIRLRGLVDDLKSVTSGGWLKPNGRIESFVAAAATSGVYLAGAFAVCSSFLGSLVLVSMLMGSAGLLTIANSIDVDMRMHGKILTVVGKPKLYKRRLDMAQEMIAEHDGRDDWAIALGMIVPERSKVAKATM